MKKYKFYIFLIIVTFIVGTIFFYLSDYSRRVKVLYSIMKEKDKEKIIENLVEKVEVDSLKEKFRTALKKFGQKIELDAYSDEHLEDILNDLQKITEANKITYEEIEKFTQKVNQDF